MLLGKVLLQLAAIRLQLTGEGARDRVRKVASASLPTCDDVVFLALSLSNQRSYADHISLRPTGQLSQLWNQEIHDQAVNCLI